MTRIALPRADGSIVVWDAGSNRPRELKGGHQGPVSLAMSRDAGTLVSSDKKGTTLVWDLTAGKPAPRRLFEGRPLVAMSISDDGRSLVARDGEPESHTGGVIGVYDLASGAPRASIDPAAAGHAAIETPFLALSPDGRHVVGHGKKGTSLLWKVDAGTLHTVGRSGFHIYSVEYSPDGRRLAAAMNDRTVLLWDLETLRTQTLRGHHDLVNRVAFSPDGKILASASYDRTVRLWDGASGRSIRVLRGHSASVQGLAFSPDGALLASGGSDGTVRLWNLSALPSDRADAVRARIDQATSARIENEKGRAASPLTSPD